VRRAARVDSNQPKIVQALRDVGADVQPLHFVGRGFPDILAGFRGKNFLIEIKDGNKRPSKRRLTPDEKKWHREWRGQVAIAESVDDALRIIGVME